MNKYNNRFSAGNCCKPKNVCGQDTDAKNPIFPKPESKDTNIGSKCWSVKVKHITRIDNKVLIMFNDCSFIEADESVLDKSLIEEDKSNSPLDDKELNSLKEKVTKLENKVAALENKPETDISNFITKDSLEPVYSLQTNKEIYKVIKTIK